MQYDSINSTFSVAELNTDFVLNFPTSSIMNYVLLENLPTALSEVNKLKHNGSAIPASQLYLLQIIIRLALG